MKTILTLSIFLILSIQISLSQTPIVNHWETAIYSYDDWKYFVGVSEPPNTWRTLEFNDSLWLNGIGGIGYGDGDDSTIISPTTSLYLRKSFTVFDLNKIELAIFNIDYDDAFVAYINDIEIARSNIGTVGDNPTFDQTATSLHEAVMYQGFEPEYFYINHQLLTNCIDSGENILTIQIHNENIISSDLSSICFLSFAIIDSTTYYGNPPVWFSPSEYFNYSNLPIIEINTLGQNIVDDPRIVCDMGIIYNGEGAINYLSDPFKEYNGKISIEIRGSSSQGFPKKSYGFETQDSLGENLNVKLLGLPKENDWILYAPYSDKTLMRNVLTYKLGNDLGRYAPRTRFCELFINQDYQGVYVLMEKIKRDKNRVDISKLNEIDTTGDQLTGGYIIKIDKTTGSSAIGWYSPFPPYAGAWQSILFQFDDPKPDELQLVQKNYIENQITLFETALNSINFSDPFVGYPAYIDVGSFIDYMIINELSNNVDGYRLSTFMYKDRDSIDPKIHMGPLWDFNLAFGNADYCNGGNTVGWAFDFNNVCSGDGYQIPFWWSKLIQDPLYIYQTKCRWIELRNTKLNTDTILNYVDSLVLYLNTAQQRNFNKWEIFGTYVWPNNFVGQNYEEEINYLKTWIINRLNWLDQNIPGNCNISISEYEKTEMNKIEVFPNPFTNIIKISFSLEVESNVSIIIEDILGRKIKTYKFENQQIGENIISLNTDNFYGKSYGQTSYILSFYINGNLLSKKLLFKN